MATIDISNSKRSSVARAAATHKEGAYLGDLVAWIFGDDDGFSHHREMVHAIFDRYGFGEYIETEIDYSRGISAAKGKVRKPRDLVVKAMARPDKDTPIALCIYRRVAQPGERGDKLVPEARVRLVNGRVGALPMADRSEADPECLAHATAIAKKANQLAEHVCNLELSVALCKVGLDHYWATFRQKQGGVWFVHAKKAASFRALLDDVEALGGFSPIIQPLYVDDQGRTTENVANASKGMLQSELERLTADLKKATDEGTMRDSTLEKRLRECDELLARADMFSSLLADKASDIRSKTDQLKAKFSRMLDGSDEVFEELATEAVRPEVKRAMEVGVDFGLGTDDLVSKTADDIFGV